MVRREAREGGEFVPWLPALLLVPFSSQSLLPARSCMLCHSTPTSTSRSDLSFSCPRPARRLARPLPCGAHPVACHKTQ